MQQAALPEAMLRENMLKASSGLEQRVTLEGGLWKGAP